MLGSYKLRPLGLVLFLLTPSATIGCGRSEKSTPSQAQPAAKTRPVPAPKSATSPGTPSRDPEQPPSTAGSEPEEAPPGSLAAALPEGLRFLSGRAIRRQIADSQAKATLVNVWASWCDPCTREFPMFVALREGLSAKGVEMLFVSVDEEGAYEDALKFAERHGEKPPIWVSEPPLSRFKRELHEAWPGMLPATFLFDENGTVRYFWGGPVYDHEVLSVVEGLLRGEAIDGETRFGLKKGVDY